MERNPKLDAEIAEAAKSSAYVTMQYRDPSKSPICRAFFSFKEAREYVRELRALWIRGRFDRDPFVTFVIESEDRPKHYIYPGRWFVNARERRELAEEQERDRIARAQECAVDFVRAALEEDEIRSHELLDELRSLVGPSQSLDAVVSALALHAHYANEEDDR